MPHPPLALFPTPQTTSPLHHLSDLHDTTHTPLATLKLATYAADALRVLTCLERHAALSPAFERALCGACPDWRNPGSLDDPADLIATVLADTVVQMQALFNQLHDLAAHPAHRPGPGGAAPTMTDRTAAMSDQPTG